MKSGDKQEQYIT